MLRGYINLDIIDSYKDMMIETKDVKVERLPDFPGVKKVNVPLKYTIPKNVMRLDILK